jgi:hypothetical protein
LVMIQESIVLSGHRWYIYHNQQKYGPVLPGE